MKRVHLLLTVLSLLSIAGCKKYKTMNDDVGGSLYIRARLYYLDDITKADTVDPLPLGNKIVKIGYAKDSAKNYIYSVKADTDGYFTFTNLQKDSSYVIYCQDTEDSVIFFQKKYYKKFGASLNSEILTLIPANGLQNGAVFTVNDNNSPAEPVTGCAVCLFRSQVLFATDTCANATYVLSTNANGLAYKMDVPQGYYYALFVQTLQPAGSLLKTKLTAHSFITVADTGISRKAVTIK